MSKEIRLKSFFTSKPETTFVDGSVYKNFKVGENSYINPPLLIPYAKFDEAEKLFRFKAEDLQTACAALDFETPYLLNLHALKGLMLESKSDSCDNLFLYQLKRYEEMVVKYPLCKFNEKTLAEFICVNKHFFKDDDLDFFANMCNGRDYEALEKCFVILSQNESIAMDVISYEKTIGTFGINKEKNDELNNTLQEIFIAGGVLQ